MNYYRVSISSPLFIIIFAFFLVAMIDFLTNTIDIYKYNWDFRFYIDMAYHRFDTGHNTAPFIYRYPTPLMASFLIKYLYLDPFWAFKILAYLGLIMELSGIFFLIKFLIYNTHAALIAMLAVGLSAFNVKFLLFDPFRPDIFAYAFILLSFYFVLKKNMKMLIFSTIVGTQFREFVLVPYIAFTISKIIISKGENWHKDFTLLIIIIFIAVVVPRLVIEITVNFQALQSLDDILKIPLDLNRDINLIYTFFAYFLPALILLTKKRFKIYLESFPRQVHIYFLVYTLLVLILSLYGGKDLPRFQSYLFLPMSILVASFSLQASKIELIYMVVAITIFNQILFPIPIENIDSYLDWYAGYADRVNYSTSIHIIIMIVLIAIAQIVRISKGKRVCI